MARWGMVIDLNKCVGCQACTIACWSENNVPHGSPEEQQHDREFYWNKVLTVTEGEYPNASIEFISMPCMHCDEAPCTTVCPAAATYRRDDGIIVQNFRKCIGCKYCMIACPYEARNYNYKDQEDLPYQRQEREPDYPSRGPWPFPHRIHGVVEKCTFCFHRIDAGLKEGKVIGVDVVPACVEACPTRARVFGDLDDPTSPASQVLAGRTPIRLREDLGTQPKVYYLPR